MLDTIIQILFISGQPFKRPVKSYLPFASIIRSSPYSPR